jgi:hypothetical protein
MSIRCRTRRTYVKVPWMFNFVQAGPSMLGPALSYWSVTNADWLQITWSAFTALKPHT